MLQNSREDIKHVVATEVLKLTGINFAYELNADHLA